MKSFALLFLFASVASARPELSFLAETEVSDRAFLTWADLAVVKEGEPELFTELKAIPYNGGGLTEIRARLRERKAASDLYSRLGLQVLLPNEFAVKQVHGYSGQEFRRKLLNLLGATCHECQFEIKSVRDEGIHLTGDWSIDESAVKATGQLLIPITCKGATAWLPVSLRSLRQGLVVKHTLGLGQKIIQDDVDEKMVDIAQLRDAPAMTKDLEGSVLTRTVTAGQVIARSDLRREDLVQRGQSVRVIAGDDNIQITASGIAEQSGHQGDLVRVKASDSGRILSAVVTGSGEVRLQ